MSWDIFVQEIPADARSVSEIPADFRPRALGSRAAIIDGIRQAVPNVDFSDPTWGVIDYPGCSIEVEIGDRDPVQSFALHVRGDDLAAGLVADVLQALDLRALDPHSKTGIFDPATALDSIGSRREYRDQAVGSGR